MKENYRLYKAHNKNNKGSVASARLKILSINFSWQVIVQNIAAVKLPQVTIHAWFVFSFIKDLGRFYNLSFSREADEGGCAAAGDADAAAATPAAALHRFTSSHVFTLLVLMLEYKN